MLTENDCPVYERGFKCVVIVESYIEDFDVYGALEDPFEFEAPFIVPMPFSAPEFNVRDDDDRRFINIEAL